MKEEELRKMAENISSSANIDLDLERLETPLSIVKKRVQSIEASLDWANTSLLQTAVNELEATLQETSILLEEGIFRIQTFLIYYEIWVSLLFLIRSSRDRFICISLLYCILSIKGQLSLRTIETIFRTTMKIIMIIIIIDIVN